MTQQMLSEWTTIKWTPGPKTTSTPSSTPATKRRLTPWSVDVPMRVARMLAADRYLLRKFCATRFGMQLHEDIVPIAEALDRSLEVCGAG